MKLRCIAVDDEKFALDLLADNISQIPYLELIATCKNALEAAVVLRREKIDLLFIDIQMPGLSGLQFVRSLLPKPLIIFITAYENFALDAFNADAIDYLVKPVTSERFLQATNKALLFSSYHNPINIHREADFIFVNVEYNIVKIVLSEVLYIEGAKDYIKIQLQQNRTMLTKVTMKSMEELLPAAKFIRIHRSYIVNIAAIEVIKKDSIMLTGNRIELPVSDGYKGNISYLTGR
ncbi:two component transcriptional regulator, LytTR family [Chitinophaga sp. YR573]|uniref:LytR/AlgR family response regulator transcription factor n=1 Tax=Chitinophaga sp. YR573 TaxID=1881040 RepID=UPI0008B8C877|nr:LytTR family DNA-binding domain-containing protein [Chitinophaga sp. YR573]SEW46867.1 two component transcriptional regulator, LytTR family [Chitinophaga sp. YR573]